MGLVVQILFSGLAAGAGYGLLAMAFAFVYRLTGVVHLALGEIASVAVLVGLFAATGPALVGPGAVGLARSIAFVVAGILAGGVVGVFAYLVGVRPLARRGERASADDVAARFGWIAGVVAVAFAIRGVLGAVAARGAYAIPGALGIAGGRSSGVVRIAGASIELRLFPELAAGAVVAGAASWFLSRTRAGAALRAIADDPGAGVAIGLPRERLLLGAFAAAGALAAVAGLFATAGGPPLTPDTGEVLALSGLAAALIAGFASPARAFAAGVALGVLEVAVANTHVGTFRLSPGWADVIPLLLALVGLAARSSARAAQPL